MTTFGAFQIWSVLIGFLTEDTTHSTFLKSIFLYRHPIKSMGIAHFWCVWQVEVVGYLSRSRAELFLENIRIGVDLGNRVVEGGLGWYLGKSNTLGSGSLSRAKVRGMIWLNYLIVTITDSTIVTITDSLLLYDAHVFQEPIEKESACWLHMFAYEKYMSDIK